MCNQTINHFVVFEIVFILSSAFKSRKHDKKGQKKSEAFFLSFFGNFRRLSVIFDDNLDGVPCCESGVVGWGVLTIGVNERGVLLYDEEGVYEALNALSLPRPKRLLNSFLAAGEKVLIRSELQADPNLC